MCHDIYTIKHFPSHPHTNTNCNYIKHSLCISESLSELIKVLKPSEVELKNVCKDILQSMCNEETIRPIINTLILNGVSISALRSVSYVFVMNKVYSVIKPWLIFENLKNFP